MQSMFDDRLWLAWLVKVRIIILTFLLAIELLIARLTPSPLPVWLFVSSRWYHGGKEHRSKSSLPS